MLLVLSPMCLLRNKRALPRDDLVEVVLAWEGEAQVEFEFLAGGIGLSKSGNDGSSIGKGDARTTMHRRQHKLPGGGLLNVCRSPTRCSG